jgi:hypothetical protein
MLRPTMTHQKNLSKAARILLAGLLVVLMVSFSLAFIFLRGEGGQGGARTASADDLTATFGAEVFHKQLTYMATVYGTPTPYILQSSSTGGAAGP